MLLSLAQGFAEKAGSQLAAPSSQSFWYWSPRPGTKHLSGLRRLINGLFYSAVLFLPLPPTLFFFPFPFYIPNLSHHQEQQERKKKERKEGEGREGEERKRKERKEKKKACSILRISCKGRETFQLIFTLLTF